MTQATRLAIALAAVSLAVATAASVHAARTGTLDLGTPTPVELVQLETSCDTLRLDYSQHHSAWKAGIRGGHDTQVEPNLIQMRAILRRLAQLDRQGACGG